MNDTTQVKMPLNPLKGTWTNASLSIGRVFTIFIKKSSLFSDILKVKIYLLLIIAVTICSCRPTFKVRKLSYDDSTGFYKYDKSVPVILPDKRLVNKDNIQAFIQFIASYRYADNNNLLYQPDWVVSKKDKELLDSYNKVIQNILNKEYQISLSEAKTFKSKLNGAGGFSDIDFWIAYAHLNLSNNDSAAYYFTQFLLYSGYKYPIKFRGHFNSEHATRLLAEQKKYAADFLEGREDLPPVKPEIVKHRYYYQSHTPGFIINHEDAGVKNFNFFVLPILYDNNFQGGQGGFSYNKFKTLNFSVYSEIEKEQQSLKIRIPWQTYISATHRLGIKITPQCRFYSSVINDENYKGILTGSSVSIGYRITHRVYAGIAYTTLYSTHDAFINKRFYRAQQLHGSYDAGIHLQLIKSFSLKLGYSDGYGMFGLLINNVFSGYNEKTKSSMFQFNDF
ncbi:MAG TPA: hypothetical protein PK252_09405 [Bacteroidales bacterium]|nr:hypothetical protein [Bacteroidales bacterium]